MNNSQICIIIPCHNEAENISCVLRELADAMPGSCILVIDDGSTDRTGELARATGLAQVVTLPVNLGVGGAVQTGFKYAIRGGFDYAVKFDGDGQHPADGIVKLIAELENGSADVVIGSRFLRKDEEGFRSSFLRRMGIGIFRILNSLLIRQKITDNTSGFRAYNRKALEFMEIYYPAFDYPEPEEVVLLGKNGFRICEIAVTMRPRRSGNSSIGIVKSFYFMLKVGFAVLMIAMRPRVKHPAGAKVGEVQND